MALLTLWPASYLRMPCPVVGVRELTLAHHSLQSLVLLIRCKYSFISAVFVVYTLYGKCWYRLGTFHALLLQHVFHGLDRSPAGLEHRYVSAALAVSGDEPFIVEHNFISFTTSSSCGLVPTMVRSTTCAAMYNLRVWVTNSVDCAPFRVNLVVSSSCVRSAHGDVVMRLASRYVLSDALCGSPVSYRFQRTSSNGANMHCNSIWNVSLYTPIHECRQMLCAAS